MNILLVQNPAKPQAKELAKAVEQFLHKKNITVIAPEQYTNAISVDLIVSLGGDGSILKIMHEFPSLDAPIMGINLGSLGFLADIGISEIFESLEQFLQGVYRIQDRLMLEGAVGHTPASFAVNEIVVHRGKNHTLIDLAVHVDGKYLNTFSADGLIVATPSGSTAYSLSSGGPILTPELDCVVITPICPHAISNRPIVLKIHKSIEIECLGAHQSVEVSFDGIPRFCLEKEQKCTIATSSRHFKLVTLKSHDYFETLRTKLGWTGTLKS